MKTPCFFFAAALIAFAGTTVQAQLVSETFDNGFPGTAGMNGWIAPWTYTANAGTPTVTNASPLNNGGNYLTYNQTGTADSGLRRSYTGLLSTADQTIQLNYRVDAFGGTLTTNQYFTITDGDNTNAGGSSADSSFIIRVFGASPGGNLPAMEWGVYNGEKSRLGYNPTNWVDSGMAFTVGTTYAFIITLHPQALSYDAVISNTVTSVSVTNLNLGFRDSSLSATNILIFNGRMADAANTETISIDSIAVDYVGGIPPVFLQETVSGGNLQLIWPQGLLLEAGTVTGPWTTNSATSPYTIPLPLAPQKYYRLLVQ